MYPFTMNSSPLSAQIRIVFPTRVSMYGLFYENGIYVQHHVFITNINTSTKRYELIHSNDLNINCKGTYSSLKRTFNSVKSNTWIEMNVVKAAVNRSGRLRVKLGVWPDREGWVGERTDKSTAWKGLAHRVNRSRLAIMR